MVSSLPEEAEILDQYVIGEEFDKSNVTILKRKKDAKPIYHLMPPEYSLEEGLQEADRLILTGIGRARFVEEYNSLTDDLRYRLEVTRPLMLNPSAGY